MNVDIDFTKKDAYRGDVVEETFKPFSAKYMPFWWHFHEVLRACPQRSPHWKKSDDTALSDDEQRELVAVSLLNYTVYNGIADAIVFLEELGFVLDPTVEVPRARLIEVRRIWKALYSSLYTSFNALCNIVCVVVGQKSPFGERPGRVWNYTPKQTLKFVEKIEKLAEPLRRCQDRLEIRAHLAHYWPIWSAIDKDEFLIDEGFEKGYVPLDPETEVSTTNDAYKLAGKHIIECAKDFNLIYRELAVENGYFDQYLSEKGWKVEYSDYEAHGRQRPLP